MVQVLERLEAALAEEVKHQISDLKEREMVFHLLGQSFVERHLNDCPIRPTSLFPDLNTFRSIGLEDNARAWLRNRCFKAAERMNCQFHFEGDAAELTPEMARFLDDAYNVVAAEMELLLAGSAVRHKERSVQESETFCKVPQLSLSREPTQTSALVQRSRSIASEDISLVLSQRPTSQIDGREKDFQWHIRPELHPPVLSCPESNLLGNMLCDIISQGSENMSIVCERLSGKLLPWMLRQFLWNDKLLRTGFENHTTQGQISVAAREAREKFEQTVAQRVAERKLRSAARSPLSGLIENAVVETYRRVPCMRPFASNEQMVLESCKSLNILYVFNGAYEPYLIYWLFPLQVAFKPIAPREQPYLLAMYLHALHGKLFPTGTEIFAMAESVMKLLEREDPEFFAHLQQAFKTNITIDPKDFLAELILQEKGSAPGIGASESEPDLSITQLLLTSPVLFLRKWMWEGFVGVLNLPAVLFVWDQLYLRDWDPEVMRDFCTAILLLLKGPFMAAGDCGAIQEVFLSCASHLLTADIRRAWVHLQQGGLPADIPGLNRLNQG
ncbi:Tyrosine--tRNA ligase [Varanus komodoensis]|nr:Tyrosine--tRNA ligase [Varanus komodoensis]